MSDWLLAQSYFLFGEPAASLVINSLEVALLLFLSNQSSIGVAMGDNKVRPEDIDCVRIVLNVEGVL